MTTIKLKNGSGAPAASDLVQGEPALDLTNKRLYTEDSGGTVIEVGTNPGTDVTFADNRKAIFGAGSDLQIYHDGSNSYITDAGTGDLRIRGANVEIQTGGGNKYFQGAANIARLYHTNNERLATTSTGIDVTGDVNSDSVTTGTFTSTGIDDNATSTAITIDSSENVGIGTTSPDTLLELAANNNSGAENNTLRFTDISANTSANQALGKIEFKTDDSSGDGPLVRAYIGAFASDTTPSTYLSFATNLGGAGTVAEEAMRINSSGEVLSSASGSWRLRPDANSALAPSYAFNGDGNTGMYSPSADTLGFSTQGTEKVRIDSSGNVGIGTTSPNNTLQVRGASTTGGPSSGNVARFEGPSGTNGLKIFVDDSANASGLQTIATDDLLLNPLGGNVGVGTTSPNALLHIASSSAQLRIEDTSGTGTSKINFADNVAGNVGILSYDHSDDSMQFRVNNFERMRIDSSGLLQIATTGKTGRINLQPNPSNNHFVEFYNTSDVKCGEINTATGTQTNYVTSSDVRLKENIVDAPAGNIDAIRVRSFDWKTDGSHQTYGMVAQELAEVAPEAVTQGETEDEMWGVDYSKLVPMMIKEIQDLKAEVAALKGV